MEKRLEIFSSWGSRGVVKLRLLRARICSSHTSNESVLRVQQQLAALIILQETTPLVSWRETRYHG